MYSCSINMYPRSSGLYRSIVAFIVLTFFCITGLPPLYGEAYLRIDGIDGSCPLESLPYIPASEDHFSYIDAYNISLSVSGGELGSPQVDFSPMWITKDVDKASVNIFRYALLGLTSPNAYIELSSPGYTVVWRLQDVIVPSYSTTGGSSTGAKDAFSLDFSQIEYKYVEYNDSGDVRGIVSFNYNKYTRDSQLNISGSPQDSQIVTQYGDVPEPSTLALLGMDLFGLVFYYRRQSRSVLNAPTIRSICHFFKDVITMKTKFSLLIALALFFTASAAIAAPGDQWILPIADLQGDGWIEHPGAGYGGASAWEGSGMDNMRRVYWKTDNTTMPSSTELYMIEFFSPLSGPGAWQPIESQISGSAGETLPNDPNIPWAGALGANHEYIGSEFSDSDIGNWTSTGPGPHTPEDADFNAGPYGMYMWLHQGSWLYAKWDFPWSIDRTWSALRLTQVTPIPEPATFVLLGMGALGFAFYRPRRSRRVRETHHDSLRQTHHDSINTPPFITLLTALLFLGTLMLPIAPASADWPGAAPKWSQLTNDLYGSASYNDDQDQGGLWTTADDFQCTTPLPINEIRFKGIGSGGIPDQFRVVFWTNTPGNADRENLPGNILEDVLVNPADPGDPNKIGWQNLGNLNWAINLPQEDWFPQQGTSENPITYWITIQGIMPVDGKTEGFFWIMRDRNDPNWGAGAVQYAGSEASPRGHWGWPSQDPSTPLDGYDNNLPDGWYKSADMSFELRTVPEPSTFVLLGMAAVGLAFYGRRLKSMRSNCLNLVPLFFPKEKFVKRLKIALVLAAALAGACPAFGGQIIGLTGVQGGPITYGPAAVVTPQPNNGAIPNPNPSPNQIQFGGISINGLTPIDMVLAIMPTSGVTEYYLDFGSALNNTGVAWNGFRFTLGYGAGQTFVPMDQVPPGTYAGNFNFITVDNAPLPATSVFNLYSQDNDTITFSGGGILSNGSMGWANVSGLVPDPMPRGPYEFTVRLEPFAVPEPETLALLGMGAAGLMFYGLRRSRRVRATHPCSANPRISGIGCVALALLLGIFLFPFPSAFADWPGAVPKWSQLNPDAPNYWGGLSIIDDVSGTAICADDFLCASPSPIGEIRFSAFDRGISPNQIRVTFWSDVPKSTDEESHPGEMLQQIYVDPAGPGDPKKIGWQTFPNAAGYNDYLINLPERDWFLQQGTSEKPITYWIAIQGVMPTDGLDGLFYWMFRDRNEDNWGDDAAFAWEDSPAQWAHWGWPYSGPDYGPGNYNGLFPSGWYKSADMAFELSTVPEPCTLVLLGMAALGSALWGWRRRVRETHHNLAHAPQPAFQCVLRTLLGLLCIAATGQIAWADQLWSQPPNMPVGTFINSMNNPNYPLYSHTTADDFSCQTSDPLSEIRWWGGFWGAIDRFTNPAHQDVDGFWIRFFTDVPAVPGVSSSHPGNKISETYIPGNCDETYYGTINIGPFDHDVYQYDVLLSTPPFIQQPGTVYWLSVQADAHWGMVNNDYIIWGWTSTDQPWNDSGVLSLPPTSPWDWSLSEPDMSFELNPVPEPSTLMLLGMGAAGLAFYGWRLSRSVRETHRNLAHAPQPAFRCVLRTLLGLLCITAAGRMAWADHITDMSKWSQPPNMSENGNLYGSMVAGESAMMTGDISADDFFCDNPSPVIGVRWWGGYWQGADPQPINGFYIRFFTNNAGGQFSHPDQKIYETYIPGNCNEQFYGTVTRPDTELNIYQYNAIFPTPFSQEPGNIYWLSVQVDPGWFEPPNWQPPAWGWITSTEQWNDFAVQAPDVLPWDWMPQGLDLAFELTVAPEPSTFVLLGMGTFALAFYGWRQLRRVPETRRCSANIRIPAFRRVARALLLGIFLLPFASAYADWPNAQLKWDQLNRDNYGAFSYIDDLYGPHIAADDFPCTSSSPICEIRFFGFGRDVESNTLIDPEKFRITFWSNVPATQDDESHPGNIIYDQTIAPADPGDPLKLGWQDMGGYEYRINLPQNQWFRQQGTPDSQIIYWIGIQGIMSLDDGIHEDFGWAIRNRGSDTWGDDSVSDSDYQTTWDHFGWPSSDPGSAPDYYDGKFPSDWWKSADLSFALYTIPEPGTLTLLVIAAAGLAFYARRRREDKR